MAKRRRFTPEFKAEVVLEALRGESSQAKLGFRRHNLSQDQLSKWKQQAVGNFTSLFTSRISMLPSRPSGLLNLSNSLVG